MRQRRQGRGKRDLRLKIPRVMRKRCVEDDDAGSIELSKLAADEHKARCSERNRSRSVTRDAARHLQMLSLILQSPLKIMEPHARLQERGAGYVVEE
jgi:hypothetical protein